MTIEEELLYYYKPAAMRSEILSLGKREMRDEEEKNEDEAFMKLIKEVI